MHGLQLAAVAVVAQAVLQMRRAGTGSAATRDCDRALVRAGRRHALTPVAVIAEEPSSAWHPGLEAGGVAPDDRSRLAVPKGTACSHSPHSPVCSPVCRCSGLRRVPRRCAVADVFARAGALVFGGGHVVLPLLNDSVVANGWVDKTRFLAGYGAAQAIPGPLFSFAAYLGAIMTPDPHGIPGALIALVAIFLPGASSVWGVLPFWDVLRGRSDVRRALTGVNAAVVGLLLAALITPVWTSAVSGPLDALIAAGAALLLVGLRFPPWAVVLITAVATEVLTRLT